MKRWLSLAGWMMLVTVAATIGGLASLDAQGFYGALKQPSWAPPGWLFGPVWSMLYLLMAIAAWRVQQRAGWRAAFTPLSVFIIQLALNAAWSWLFFSWHSGFWSLSEVIALWLAIVLTIVLFWRHDRIASILLVPYLAWVSFASVLTWTLWQRNPALLG